MDLITDRTINNVKYSDPKGKYDYEDYNRVGAAANEIANILGISVNLPTDYERGDIPRDSEMTTYRKSIEKIGMALTLKYKAPENNANILTIDGANTLEYILLRANELADQYDFLRWSDLDAMNETWSELDAKKLTWKNFFTK